jgi:hypothetical protein
MAEAKPGPMWMGGGTQRDPAKAVKKIWVEIWVTEKQISKVFRMNILEVILAVDAVWIGTLFLLDSLHQGIFPGNGANLGR